MADLRETIRSERLALIDLLETLGAEEWATPSLCGAWTVQEVAAHLAWSPRLTIPTMATGMVRAGLRINKFNADVAVRWASRGSAEILEQLRRNAADDAKPLGVPRMASLVDSVVHAIDIRRPIGKPRPVPPEAFTMAAEFCARTRWPASMVVGGSVVRRLEGLRLVADDVDWTWGEGAEVRGSSETLMLVLTGRPIGSSDVSGPGAPTLLQRLP